MKNSEHHIVHNSEDNEHTFDKQQLLTADISYQDLVDEASYHQRDDWAAHMTPSMAPYSQLGMQLALQHHGNLLSPDLYPKLKQAETEIRATLADEFGFSHARFTHGGSYSNLDALWQARNQSSHNKKMVYASEASHYSIIKACDILGIAFEAIPCNTDQQIDLTALEKKCAQDAPIAIIANMGTSATGAIDPIEEIAAISAKYASWLHIDAAWGGANLLIDKNDLFKKFMPNVDSLSFDPHKSLFQPRPCSVLFSHSQAEHINDINYLSEPPEKTISGSYGAELFLPLWLNWNLLGKNWFIDKITYRLEQAEHFACRLRQHTNWPVINHGTGIVCFKPDHDDLLAPLINNGTVSVIKLNQTRYHRVIFAGLDTSAEKLLKALRPFL